MEKQKAIRRFAENWNVKSWINLNSTIPVSVEGWFGQDDFQKRYGMDKVLLEAINYVLEIISTEQKHTSNNSSSQSQPNAGLEMPKNLLR
jgi:hypothetical protein